MSDALRFTLDGRVVLARDGETVLDVATREGTYIPTLCFDPRLAPFGACRACLVGVQGARGPVAACTTPVREGMVVDTRDPVAFRVGRGVVELVLSDFPEAALTRDDDRGELRAVARHFGLEASRWQGERHADPLDDRHPYLTLKLDECIVCGRCVRACDEIQGTFALTYTGRGFETRIAPGIGHGFTDSACVSCGACASACPTGAIDESPFRESARVDRVVGTTCGYCGVGCRLDIAVRDERIVSSEPALDGPSNHGHTCLKGRFAHGFVLSPERLTHPLIREGDGFRKASWDEALSLVATRLLAIRDAHGPDAIAALSSSRGTNEDNYAMQKLLRAVIGTHNVDNCSRVCHSPSSAGLIRSLGHSGGTNSYDDIEGARTLLIAGANATEGHPVLGARLKQRALAGAKLVVIDPRRVELARYADVFLQLRPGTNVAVFHGLAHVVMRDGLFDRDFLAARVDDVDTYRAFLADYSPARVEEISGVPAHLLERAAHLYGEHSPAGIYYGLGVTEQSQGVAGVRALVNLATITGNLGRDGAGVNPLRGQNNVQGGSDMGALPTTLTMYQPVTDAAVRARFEARWGVTLKGERGLMIPEMFDAAIAGTLKAMYAFGEDIAQTDPNTGHVVKALRALEFFVVQELFMSETAKLAHVVLPGASFLEKEGTFTNAERRIQKVNPVVAPPGEARTDFEIFLDLAARMGRPLGFSTPAEAMDEVASLSPALAGVSHKRLGRKGLQWPVPDATHPGTTVLYRDRFETATGRAQLARTPWQPPGEAADEMFPMILVTGRQLAHYNAGTMTRHTGNAVLHPTDCVEINPQDAVFLGIAEGDEVEVASRRGSVRTFAHLTDRSACGEVFLSFHVPDVLTNLLTSGNSDAYTRCPEYKISAVRVTKFADGAGRMPAWHPGIHPGA